MNLNHEEMYACIGRNIAYYRKLRNLSQLELAERINMSRTHLSCIEAPNMNVRPSLNALLDIAVALDIPASYLLDTNDPFKKML